MSPVEKPEKSQARNCQSPERQSHGTQPHKWQSRQRWLAGLAIGVVALAASGCSSSNKSSTSSSPTSGGTVAPGSGTKVTVSETEYKLALSPDSFTAGPYTFTAVNNGKIVHALEVDGPGVHAVTGDLEPGQSASVSVQLQAGKYDVFCPIPGHKALGMNEEITVGAGSGSAGSGGAGASTPPSSTPSTTKGSSGYGY
jgi:plastocyanin